MYKLGIVDDEPKLLAGLCNYYPWNELGFEITAQMRNGQEVVEYLKKDNLNVIFTDIAMPTMDGIELAKKLYETYPNILIVFLSGYADFKYAQQALKYDVFDYILKPVKQDDIIKVFTAIRNKLDIKFGEEKSELGYYERIISNVNRYMEDNISEVTLIDVAQKVNLSPGYLSSLYRRFTGCTFSEYLTELKMTYAKKLLMDINLKTYHVAEMLGYEDPKNFTRAFRTYYGTSPREFKKRGTGAKKENEEHQC